ncbi:hypothetical protein [Streptosporangium sp. NPDC000396]|uniref:hypothetical protein n=1 Tax=Streptosporangium sp. NPDC000396 TaxID=3366185 RepID=UPI00369492C4
MVFPDFGLGQALPAFTRTAVELVPRSAGQYGFACGMNMVRGRLIVESGDGQVPDSDVGRAVPAAQMETTDAEATERHEEIADLPRRVLVGAALELFGATWTPGFLLNRWVQLLLITPVMFYTGWPIHRAADMNSLITLGTTAAHGYSLLATVAPQLLPATLRDVYSEAVGVILTLILLGRLLEARAKAGTGEAIRKLVGLQGLVVVLGKFPTDLPDLH